jgi:hypothetical protein
MGYLEVGDTMEQTFGTGEGGGAERWVMASGKARDLGSDRGYRVAEQHFAATIWFWLF